ncbi:cuticle collagen 39-like [Dasypus novemcinctus]|uniref:cuticle collagen 39-like n=1 Tax=Dasypus novemcinctus TaxID=9361 RepID=UPI0039C9835D
MKPDWRSLSIQTVLEERRVHHGTTAPSSPRAGRPSGGGARGDPGSAGPRGGAARAGGGGPASRRSPPPPSPRVVATRGGGGCSASPRPGPSPLPKAPRPPLPGARWAGAAAGPSGRGGCALARFPFPSCLPIPPLPSRRRALAWAAPETAGSSDRGAWLGRDLSSPAVSVGTGRPARRAQAVALLPPFLLRGLASGSGPGAADLPAPSREAATCVPAAADSGAVAHCLLPRAVSSLALARNGKLAELVNSALPGPSPALKGYRAAVSARSRASLLTKQPLPFLRLLYH